jgi:hypothetical protein
MPININFNKTNNAIKMMLQMMMEKKMGELSGKRQMDVASYQDKLIRDRSAEEDVRARGLKEYGSEIDVQAHIKKILADNAKENDPYKAAMQASLILESQGDTAGANAKRLEALQQAGPAIDAYLASLEGKTSRENLMSGLTALGPDGLKNMMDQTFSSQKQGLEKEKLGLERQKFGLDERKFVAEQGGGGGQVGKEYITRKTGQINNALGFLAPIARYMEGGGASESTGDPIEDSLMRALSKVGGSGKDLSQYAPAAGVMSEDLSEMLRIVIDGNKLTADQEQRLNEARNPAKMLMRYKEKLESAKPKPTEWWPPKALESFGQPSPPSPTAPVPAPAPASAPITPIRKYVLNTKTGEQYWVSFIGGQWVKE